MNDELKVAPSSSVSSNNANGGDANANAANDGEQKMAHRDGSSGEDSDAGEAKVRDDIQLLMVHIGSVLYDANSAQKHYEVVS